MYAVLVENDESQWSDDTGILYHFPKRYGQLVTEGVRVLYYKGKMQSQTYAASRLSAEPHYFGTAVIGAVYADPQSKKGDLFATIDQFRSFATAVPIRRPDHSYFEVIPDNRKANYWRDGVRKVEAATFQEVVQAAGLIAVPPNDMLPAEASTASEYESVVEGSPTLRYVTTYERNPRYRRQALAIHGLACKACGVDMKARYGPHAEGLIHVHHVVPVSTYETPKKIDPAKDLVPVCPNCHAVIHRKKTMTLSIQDLQTMLATFAGT